MNLKVLDGPKSPMKGEMALKCLAYIARAARREILLSHGHAVNATLTDSVRFLLYAISLRIDPYKIPTRSVTWL